MGQKIIYIIYKLIYYFDCIIKNLFSRSILILVKEFIENDLYYSKIILGKKNFFFTPNRITKWRVDTFFNKEPETLEWIDNFKNKGKREIIFWDIGANIGLYSIYAAQKHKNIKVESFEPSTSNLRILSRNIYLNKLVNKISINPIALSNKSNQKSQIMNESIFLEGAALHSFKDNINFEGKNFISKNSYKTIGFSIDELKNILKLKIPDYIKIDVDGLEHIILASGKEVLRNKKIRSISVEINENFKKQLNNIKHLMKLNSFVFKHKKNSSLIEISKEFQKSYNYIFERE